MDYRSERMRSLIIQVFLECLETEDFSTLTVGHIAEKAKINRSTFYRHFEDKYMLRDEVADELVLDFVNHLEMNFLEVDIRHSQSHSDILRHCLESVYRRKRELLILWNQKLLGRNVFEEMIDSGAKKIETAILRQKSILPEKKEYADWYAQLLANNMLVTIRWWFDHSDRVTSAQVTDMMKHHMMAGTIPTLKGTDT